MATNKPVIGTSLPKFNSLGQPIVFQSSSSSESSVSEESFGETIQEQNLRYMREQRLGSSGNTTSLSSPQKQQDVEQQVKAVMGVQFPLKGSAPPLTPLKKDATIPLNRATNTNDVTTADCMNLSCGTCGKCRRERNKMREWRDPVLGAVMPVMTSAPVEQRFQGNGATTKGITTTVPTSKLVNLTKGATTTPTKSILTPLTKEDYLTTTTSGASISLGHHEGGSCGVKGHRYKEKTEPRVLAPFGETAEQKSGRLSANNNGPVTQPLTAQDRAQFGLKTPVFKLNHPTADRMAVTFDMLQRFESPGMASLMTTGSPVMNLACSPCIDKCGAQCSTSLVHEIKCHHPEFFHLLHENNLVDHLLYPGLLVIIPDRASLLALPQTKDAPTANLMRYHLVKAEGVRPQDVQGVQQFETWGDEAAKVQIEKREEYGGFHTINGKQLLRSDPNFMDIIFHVRGGTLRPEDVMPVAAEPAQPDGGEEATTSGEEEEEATTTSSTTTTAEEPTVQSQLITSSALQMRMRTVPKDGSATNSNKSLQAALDKMNCGFYAPNVSLGFSVIKNEVLDLCHGVDIALSVFNTRRLFGDYQANAMNTVSRVTASQTHQMHFPAHAQSQTHVNHGVGAEYVEYEVNPTATTTKNTSTTTGATLISRTDLQSGLVGLSFTSPYDNDGARKRHTMALCRLEASAQDANVFMSKDENIIMRFKGPYLHLLSINHKALSAASTDVDGLQREHFLELPAMSVTADTNQPVLMQSSQHHQQQMKALDNAFYLSRLDKARFDDLLLTHASLKKFVKKARRAAGKAAGKAKRMGSKVSSSSLLQVPSRVLLTSEFQAAVDGVDASGGTPVKLQIMQYDKSHKARSSSASNQLKFKKVDATVGRESILVYVPDDVDNRVAADFGASGLTKFVDFAFSDRGKLSLNVSKLPSANRSSSVFYTTSGADILVFRFGDDGSLTALYSINKRYDLARRLIQARQK